VRGSPLLRSILILLALAASSLALIRLTHSQSAPVPTAKKNQPTAATTVAPIPYRLVLSAEAAEISIAADSQPPLNQPAGQLSPTSKNPVISLTVRWKTPPAPGEQRFAKLTLDPPGKETITHVFDAAGDIDDLLELP
jgi:hypothetical protein